MEDLQRRWVTERLSQVAFYLILGRQVKLLEQLRRDGDAASGPDPVKRLTRF